MFYCIALHRKCNVVPGELAVNNQTYTVKMNMLYQINKIVPTDYNKYYSLN